MHLIIADMLYLLQNIVAMSYLIIAAFCISVAALRCYHMIDKNGNGIYAPLDELEKYLVPANERECGDPIVWWCKNTSFHVCSDMGL